MIDGIGSVSDASRAQPVENKKVDEEMKQEDSQQSVDSAAEEAPRAAEQTGQSVDTVA